MKRTLAFAAIVLAIVCSAQVPSPDLVDQEQRRLAKWTEFLSSFAKTENICLVTPVTTRNWPPNPFGRRYGVTSLWMLGELLSTEYSIQEGTVAYQLALDRPETAPGSGQAWVADWLSTATDAEISAALAEEGLSLGSMAPTQRLSGLTRIGMYNEVLEGFAANGSGTKLMVRFAVQVTGTDATGKRVQFTVDPEKTIDRSKEDAEPFNPEDIPADSIKRAGELDFAEGQIVTVRDLKATVKEKLAKELAIDPRLEDSLVFLAGRFSFEKLLPAVKYALSVAPVDEVERIKSLSKAEITKLVETRLADALAEYSRTTGIDPKWAMDGRTMSAAAIADRNVAFKNFLDSRGLNSSTLQVTLVPKVKFYVTAPGKSKGISPNPAIPASTYHHSFTFSYPIGNGK